MSVAKSFHAVLLAGGSGTRLWPLSTREVAKQFLKIGSDQSLLTRTARRLAPLFQPDQLWVVCGADQVEQVRQHLPEVPAQQILGEPVPRNTLPAIAWAASAVAARDPQATMVVLPSDHWVPDGSGEAFRNDLQLAREVAEREGGLVTLGIPPRSADTGFGYIQVGEKKGTKESGYFAVKKFHEKPKRETAESYLTAGGYFWNAGIFVWPAGVFLNELKEFQPEVFQALPKLPGSFPNLPSLSVDYGVMEKSRRVFLVPATFQWDDVGNFSALKNILPSDGDGNHSQGRFESYEARNNLVVASSRTVALLGVEGLAVIETPDAVLVLPEERAQDVKLLVEKIQAASARGGKS